MSQPTKPPRLTFAAVAAPALPMAALTLPLVTFVPEYYVRVLGLELSVVGMIFMIVRLIDIGIDPVIGAMMDRTRSRHGRFKPWLLVGAPLTMAGTAALFLASPGVGPAYLLLALLLTYAGYSTIVLAQLALSAGLADDYDGRSHSFAWWQAATTTGLVLVLLLPALVGTPGQDSARIVPAMGVFILVTTPIAVAATLIGMRDATTAHRADRARIADYFRLFRRNATRRLLGAELCLGLVAGITAASGIMFILAVKQLTIQQFGIQMLVYFLTAILSAPVWTIIARRIEKHKALILSALCYICFLFLSWLVPPGRIDLILIVSILGGFSFTASSMLPRSMLADIGDEERLDTGTDRTGLLYALLTGIYKIGQAVSIGIVFLLLDWFHYDVKAGAANSAAALTGVSMIYILLPILFAGGAALLMLGYPLTAARHRAIRHALDTGE